MRNVLGVAVLLCSISTTALADADTYVRKLHAFPQTAASEGSGMGQLIVHSNGNVYGIRDGGGTNNAGVFFRMTPDGTFTVLQHFGTSPAAGTKVPQYPKVIVEDAVGDIYIGLNYGGYVSGEGGAGLVKYSPGSGTTTWLPPTADSISITGWTALIDGGDGYLYATADGGVAAPPDNTSNKSGVIFKILKSTGAQTPLRWFGLSNPAEGNSPNSIIKGTDGFFYGSNLQAGGTVTNNTPEASGTLWRINSTGSTFQTLHLFKKVDDDANGETPIALTLGSDGYLWGQTQTGGTTNDMGTTAGSAGGVLFRFTIATQTYTPIATRKGLSRDYTGNGGGEFRHHPLIESGDYLYSIHPLAVYRFSKTGVIDSLAVFEADVAYFLKDLARAADGSFYVLGSFYGVTTSTGQGSIAHIAMSQDTLTLTANPTTVPDGGGTTLNWASSAAACYSYGGPPYDGTYSDVWGGQDRAGSGCAESVVNHGPYSGALNLFYAMRCEVGGGYVTASRTIHMTAEAGTTTGPACSGGGGGGGGGGEPVALTKGQAVAISGASSSTQEFYIDIPAGATNASVTTSGGTGDLDLYVRVGQRATTSLYDCKSAGGSNAETCEEPAPDAARYYILVHGFNAFSGASIVADYTPAATGGGGDGEAIALTKGVARAISGADESMQEFYIDIPAGATNASVTTSGGTGDLDLYVRRGQSATTELYDCHSAGGTNAEECVEATPDSGRYYILVHGYTAFSGASIVANYTAPTGGGGGGGGGDEEEGGGGGGGGGPMGLGLLLFALLRRRR